MVPLTKAVFLGSLQSVLEDEFRGFPLPLWLHSIQRNHWIVRFSEVPQLAKLYTVRYFMSFKEKMKETIEISLLPW